MSVTLHGSARSESTNWIQLLAEGASSNQITYLLDLYKATSVMTVKGELVTILTYLPPIIQIGSLLISKNHLLHYCSSTNRVIEPRANSGPTTFNR